MGFRPSGLLAWRSAPKQPADQRQDDADHDAGHNGEIERKVTLLDRDIAGEFSNPTEQAGQLPQAEADHNQYQPDDEDKLSYIRHQG